MNYEEMSDFDVNRAVTLTLNLKLGESVRSAKDNTMVILTNIGYSFRTIDIIDYCNGPSDTWPIIFDNKISLIFDWEKIGLYTATGTHSVIRKLGERKTKKEVTHENPLRAAMIVFLMMNEGES